MAKLTITNIKIIYKPIWESDEKVVTDVMPHTLSVDKLPDNIRNKIVEILHDAETERLNRSQFIEMEL